MTLCHSHHQQRCHNKDPALRTTVLKKQRGQHLALPGKEGSQGASATVLCNDKWTPQKSDNSHPISASLGEPGGSLPALGCRPRTRRLSTLLSSYGQPLEFIGMSLLLQLSHGASVRSDITFQENCVQLKLFPAGASKAEPGG